MSIQYIELAGERYVILPEREYLELQRKLEAVQASQAQAPAGNGNAFREVTPLKVGGVPASEMLIRDRR